MGQIEPQPKKDKWYFKNSALIIIFLIVGPLVLPFVWVNPRLDKKSKLFITIAVLVISYVLWALMQASIKSIYSYYSQIFP